MARVYLDWNATAPLRPQARAAMVAACDVIGNPSSVHAEGRAARALVEHARSEEHTSELQSLTNLVCRLLLEKKKPDAIERIRLDTYIGMAFSNLVALAIIVTTAATLHAGGGTDIATSRHAAEATPPGSRPLA